MGPPPVAVVGPAQLVNPGRPVRLDGAQSLGDPPLVYRWTQLSGPTVTLSDNDSPTAEDAAFTAPAAGTVLEFSLAVVDRFGRASANLAIARVAVGQRPTARFVPDGGLVFAGVPTPLQSVSIDDGGLPILGYSWTLTPGSSATLTTDGGSAAVLLPAALPFGSPDGLAEVTLEVTNSIGATSTPFSRVFVVRAVNPNNWTLDAGPQGPLVEVFDAATVVSLTGFVEQSVVAPGPTFSWACTPAQTLLGATALNASFVAPVIAGPDVPVSCTLTGTASFPLSPLTQSATAFLTLRDRVLPQVVRGLSTPTRLGPFGMSVEFDEDVDSTPGAFFSCAGDGFVPAVAREDARMVTWRNNTGPFVEGGLCTATDLVKDRSPAGNTRMVSLLSNATVQTQWDGPYLSTATFADPRPVLASLGTFPKAQQRRWNVPNPRPAPTQLLAVDGALLVPLLFDAYATVPCASPCSIATGFPQSLGLGAGAPPAGQRTFWSGAAMLVSVRPGVYAQRSPTGTWSVAPPVPGFLLQGRTDVKAISQDGGVLNLWTRAETSSTFAFTEPVATGVSAVAEVVGSSNQLVARTASEPSTLRVWDRGATTWTERGALAVPPVDAGTLIYAEIGQNPALHLIAHLDQGGGYGAYRAGDSTFTFSGTPYTNAVPSTGFHAAPRGAVLYVASVENGLLRLYQHPWQAVNGPSVVPGPPRSGFTPPYPQPLNVNLSCEAAAPHLTFVEDSLVITWQERCPPMTAWNVAVRVIR